MKPHALICLIAGGALLAACEAGPYDDRYDPPSYASGYSYDAPRDDYGYYSGPTPPSRPGYCADMLHQNRPGGTDYYGPRVYGC